MMPVPGVLNIQWGFRRCLHLPCVQCLPFIWYPLHSNKGPPSAKLGKKETSSPSPGQRQPGHLAQEQSSLGRVQEDNKMPFSSSWHPAPPFIFPRGSPRMPLETFTSSSPIHLTVPLPRPRNGGKSSYFSMFSWLKTLFNPQKEFCKTSYVFTL